MTSDATVSAERLCRCGAPAVYASKLVCRQCERDRSRKRRAEVRAAKGRTEIPWLPYKATPEQRYWVKVDLSVDCCWEWAGAITKCGYGTFTIGYKSVYAHRVAYEWLIGSIPEGLELDHLCRNRRCVRPDHLEPVTREENLRRGRAARAHEPVAA